MFNLRDIVQIFGDLSKNSKLLSLKNQKIFSRILRQYGINSLKKPKSQVKNLEGYLQSIKIYSIRCRSRQLMLRNQSR